MNPLIVWAIVGALPLFLGLYLGGLFLTLKR
jgi:hypothetical protein